MDVKCNFKQGKVNIALKFDGYYVWDTSVIKAEGKYWMFVSRWKKELGFGWNWLFHSQVVLASSEKPEGPYKFEKIIFERRNKKLFDGMNTHNPTVRYFNGKFYLFYMGCTYDFEPPKHDYEITMEMVTPTWYSKRIGLAIANKIDGDYIRKDEPILLPRKGDYWDSGITTNPAPVVFDNGETYLLYKSKIYDVKMDESNPLKVGVAHADNIEGPYTRYFDKPILDEPGSAYEDPYIWFDKEKNRFCVLLKDCNGSIGGEYGDLLYAESDDCKHFYFAKTPRLVSRHVTWVDGHQSHQCNLERPCLLFDENGVPTHLFCASGSGDQPYYFKDETYILCVKLEKADDIDEK